MKRNINSKINAACNLPAFLRLNLREFLFFNLPFLLLLLLSFGFVCAANAQDEGVEETGEIVRIETDLVPFEVSVTDKDGNPVRGLDAKDFKIYEDGTEREIDFFQPVRKRDETRPL